MATEIYFKTMAELKKDYIQLQENEDKISFSFKDYVENYFKFLDSEQDTFYSDLSEDEDESINFTEDGEVTT